MRIFIKINFLPVYLNSIGEVSDLSRVLNLLYIRLLMVYSFGTNLIEATYLAILAILAVAGVRRRRDAVPVHWAQHEGALQYFQFALKPELSSLYMNNLLMQCYDAFCSVVLRPDFIRCVSIAFYFWDFYFLLCTCVSYVLIWRKFTALIRIFSCFYCFFSK